MAETWGNGHYSCYGCKHQSSKDIFDCKSCLSYTPMMQPYYKNWTKKEMSNGDKIRSMSDEELAEWLHNITQFDGDDGELMISIYNLDSEKDEEIRDSYGDLLDWLKSPATD